jgi:hypothetical protein
MQRQTGSRNDERLARSLEYQRRRDAALWEVERKNAVETEARYGNNDMSGKPSLMKAMGSPPRVTGLTSWVEGVPAAPWRDYGALTGRFSPRSKRAVKPAYAM